MTEAGTPPRRQGPDGRQGPVIAALPAGSVMDPGGPVQAHRHGFDAQCSQDLQDGGCQDEAAGDDADLHAPFCQGSGDLTPVWPKEDLAPQQVHPATPQLCELRDDFQAFRCGEFIFPSFPGPATAVDTAEAATKGKFPYNRIKSPLSHRKQGGHGP